MKKTGKERKTAPGEAPCPHDLKALAEQMPRKASLVDNFGSICILKQKGYSFREIAMWLTEHGVACDHNAVYRAYIAGLANDEDGPDPMSGVLDAERKKKMEDDMEKEDSE